MSNPPRKPRASASSSTGTPADNAASPVDAQPTRLREVPAPAKQGPAGETAELHADIDRTREQLSQTVEALAHKVDVPAQVKAKTREVTQTVQAKAGEVTQQVTDQATRATDAVQAKTEDVTARTKGLIDQALAALPPAARDRVERAAGAARQRPAPTAVVAGVVVLVLRRLLRRRRRAGS
jgi:ElaB/YqjD/DUF883 family membrane-anchored ribosome-binding protein